MQRPGRKSACCPRAQAWRPSGQCGRPTSAALPCKERLSGFDVPSASFPPYKSSHPCGQMSAAAAVVRSGAKERRVARSIPRYRCPGFSAGRVPSPCEGCKRPTQGEPRAGSSMAEAAGGAERKSSAATGPGATPGYPSVTQSAAPKNHFLPHWPR